MLVVCLSCVGLLACELPASSAALSAREMSGIEGGTVITIKCITKSTPFPLCDACAEYLGNYYRCDSTSWSVNCSGPAEPPGPCLKCEHDGGNGCLGDYFNYGTMPACTGIPVYQHPCYRQYSTASDKLSCAGVCP